MKYLVWLVTAVCALAFAPAAAGADEAAVSSDGATWATSLERPLFDGQVRWAPGDSRTESFYVRNQGSTSSRLTIQLQPQDADGLVVQGDVVLQVRADGGAWSDLEHGQATPLLDGASLPAGAATRIELNAAFDPSSGNRTQLKRLDFDLRITLTEATLVLPPDGDGDAGPGSDGGTGPGADSGTSPGADGGTLPKTGALLLPAFIWLAAVLLGGGAAFVVRRREPGAHDG